MQRMVGILCFFILLSAETAAQNLVGFKGGLNWSGQRYRIEGEPVRDNSSRLLAFHAGLVYERPTSGRTGLIVELVYSLEGAKPEGDQGELRIHYLQLPVLYYYAWPSGLRINGGAVFSYLLNARANSHGVASDRRDAYENFTFGIAAGADYNLYRGIRTGVRYNLGLSNFLNQEFYTFDLRSHCDNFQVFLAFTFKPE